MLKIDDYYVAFCFDEAVTEFICLLENGKKPRFINEDISKKDNPGLKMLLG